MLPWTVVYTDNPLLAALQTSRRRRRRRDAAAVTACEQQTLECGSFVLMMSEQNVIVDNYHILRGNFRINFLKPL